jgi:sphingomyelin phosphodiesterase acid-like 3
MTLQRWVAGMAAAALLPLAAPAGAQGAAARAGTTSSSPDGAFLALSDIHFDPLADPALLPRLVAAPVARWGKIFAGAKPAAAVTGGADTNYALFESTLQAAGGRRYDFVLHTGDMLRHDFREAFVAAGGRDADFDGFAVKTIAFVAGEIGRRFPGAPLVGAIGNNDDSCGDYRSQPGSPSLDAAARSLPLVAADREATRDFRAGGYYAVRHPKNPKHWFLVLNDVFWSPKYRDACGRAGVDPGSAELGWLEQRLFLASLAGETASLVMHIPPGYDPYGSSRSSAPSPFWIDTYRDRFLAITAAYAPVLTAGYAGHTHMDDFRIVSSAAAGPYLAIRITPSVTPLFANNPSFTVMRYRRSDARPVDYQSFVRDSGAWRPQYSFRQVYGLSDYDPASLAGLAASIRMVPATRALYSRFYASSAPSPVTAQNYRFYACGQTELLAAAYLACTKGP